MENKDGYHVPVMLQECLTGLKIIPEGIYVDVTFGGGGHSKAILKSLSVKGHLYGFDQDADAMQNIPQSDKFTFVRSNFRFLSNWLEYYQALPVDGILADLGVSSHHFDAAERGFSIREEGPLDMRMNQKSTLTAADVLNNYEERELTQIFDVYGELKNARQLSQAIIRSRQTNGALQTTGQLQKVIGKYLNPAREKKDMAKVFQALRIEVNGEMNVLKQMLLSAIDCLKPGGRLVVLSYHSLEDRIVKNIMKSGNELGVVEKDFYGNVMAPLVQLKGFPQTPSKEEQERNPRSRSAKLRVAEKK